MHTNQITERSAAQVEINIAHIPVEVFTCAYRRHMYHGGVVRRLGASFPAETVKVAILSAYQTLGYDRPTEDQERAVTKFVYGRDVHVFISLPTGSGKSLCFIWLPLVFEYFPTAVQDKRTVLCWCWGRRPAISYIASRTRPRLPTRDISTHTDGAGPYGLR